MLIGNIFSKIIIITFDIMDSNNIQHIISMSKCEIVGSGLVNMGNTCFFNATIQCLLHSVPFSRDLMQKRHS
jgi:ubiquitin C-terminal hydrolase